MSGIRPVTVVSWAKFKRNPALMYNLFSLNPSTMEFTYDTDKVLVLIGKGKGKRGFRVETADDLKAVERRLLEKPMLLRCQLSLTRSESYLVAGYKTGSRGEFAVLLNPLCHEIRLPMKQKFYEAMALLSLGKNFSLEFNLCDALTSWYSKFIKDEGGGWISSESARCSTGTRMTITNHTPYNHVFDCSVFWCTLCLPCWCATAPCYMCHRSVTCDDISHLFDVPVVYLSPMSSEHVMELTDISEPPPTYSRLPPPVMTQLPVMNQPSVLMHMSVFSQPQC